MAQPASNSRRPRREDVAGARESGYARRDVDGHAPNLVALQLDFAGVHSGANLDAEL